jgi:ZipA-like protein with FtsZ-binding domain
MSDLQLALIGIGALVVAGVYGYNWYQEGRFRREAEHAFGDKPEDALFRRPAAAPAADSERIEPTLGAGAPAPDAAAEPRIASAAPGQRTGADADIEYVVELMPRQPVRAEALASALQRRGDFGKPVRWLGLNAPTGAWEEIQPGFTAPYAVVQGALQLVDRAGPVSMLKLCEFRDLAVELGSKLEAEVMCPDPAAAQTRAAELDEFCADADVMMAVNVVSRSGAAFAATKIRGLAEAAGCRLEPDGVFRFIDEDGVRLYSLGNQEDAPFLADAIKTMTTRGVTFLLEVPRVGAADRAFDAMVSVARQLGASLGGDLVDDNRVPLNDAAVQKIKAQLRTVCARMESRGIPAGSERALRLFS